MSCRRGVSAAADLRCASARRQRLCARRLHHCCARRHGIYPRRDRGRVVRRCRREPFRPDVWRKPRPARNFRHLHPGAAGPPDRTVRSEGMSVARAYGSIAITTLLLALLPVMVQSNTVINALVIAMIIALAAQGWNLLAGYGGQFSFGHAAFFGAGAYGN